ncbi:MAG: type I restriction enzyme HsdR N-terminal domain-containing protein [Bacteroidaceae bacterium]|nr:type I restriction enzyme HsdR N-terminal domain-containing protein [Bacteroidaceae bacterium]
MNLNLPDADIRIEKRHGLLYLWDPLRSRWIRLTPEEWVRQHFTAWMISDLGYPKGRMAHEISLQAGAMKMRCDAVFYDQQGMPQIIMEFKAPDVPITQSTCDQIIRYNRVLHVPMLIISNGMQHFCCKIADDEVRFLPEVPRYAEPEGGE